MAWLTGWSKRKKITVPAASVTGTHSNYPLRVKIEDDADILAAARSDGGDIRFTSDDGETLLDHNTVGFSKYIVRNAVWTWYNDPRAVYSASENATYVGYLTNGGVVTIGKYDHDTGSFSTFALRTLSPIDDHDNPAVMIRDDGRIMVAYTQHNSATVYTRVSTNAHDISAWGSEVLLPTSSGDYSYAHLYQFSNGDIIVFYRFRISGVERDTRYRVSTDGGATWGTEQRLFYVATERPYFKACQVGDILHFCSTTSQPNEVPLGSNDLYHYYMDYNDGSPNFYESDGTLIGDETALPLTPADVTLAFDATASGDNAWNWAIAADESGNVAIVYQLSDGNPQGTTVYPVVYRYAYWNGTSWSNNDIVTTSGVIHADLSEQYYTAGLTIDPDDLSKVYLCRSVDGNPQLFLYETADSGSTWTPTQLTSDGNGKKFRPFAVKGGHADAKVLYLEGLYSQFIEDFLTNIRAYPGNIGENLTVSADVEVPSLSSGGDTEIYMYYGKADATDASSAANTYPNLLNRVEGDMVNQSGAVLDLSSKTALTFECVYKANAFSAALDEPIFANWTTTQASAMARFANTTNSPFEGLVIGTGNTTVAATFTDLIPTADQVEHAAMVLDGAASRLRGYLNGTASATTGTVSAMDADASTEPMDFGVSSHTTNNRLNGSVMLFRLWDEVKSADWIATSADNHTDPGGFSTLGTEEDAPLSGAGPRGGVMTGGMQTMTGGMNS
jgi:hypothetical protein